MFSLFSGLNLYESSHGVFCNFNVKPQVPSENPGKLENWPTSTWNLAVLGVLGKPGSDCEPNTESETRRFSLCVGVILTYSTWSLFTLKLEILHLCLGTCWSTTLKLHLLPFSRLKSHNWEKLIYLWVRLCQYHPAEPNVTCLKIWKQFGAKLLVHGCYY